MTRTYGDGRKSLSFLGEHSLLLFALANKSQTVYTIAMDKLTPEQRSRNMAQIKSYDTKPEKIVRSQLHHMGYRFRLHVKTLPGTPDIVLPRHKTVIFVHGCFWHKHNCPEGNRVPKSNVEYWISKIERNVIRDEKNQNILRELGWNVFTIWDCMTHDLLALQKILSIFLAQGSINRHM